MSGRSVTLIAAGCVAATGAASASSALDPVVYRGGGLLRRVILSPIEPIDGPIRGAASLGRPRVDRDAAAPFAVPAITNPEEIEREIAAALNDVRRTRKLRPLRIAKPLERAGDAHANALALVGAFTHDWPTTRSPYGRWIVRYYPPVARRRWSVGENLLWAEDDITPRRAAELWLSSKPHRRILLAPYWREIGVGVVRAERAGGVFGGRTVLVVAAEFGAR